MEYIDIAEKFKPIFIIHEDEKYLPLSFTTYVKGCDLIDVKNNIKIVEYPSLTIEKLVDPNIDPRLTSFQPTKDISLNLVDESVKYGTSLDKDVDIYVFINEIIFDGITYIDIVYNILYGYNGFKNIYAKDFHNFDSEFVTVRIKKDSDSLTNMFFSAHGDGQWHNEKDIIFKDNRPICFIAIGSHSNWPTQGKQVRLLGFGNDFTTSKKETEWRIFDPKLVFLTSFLQNPFPLSNYSYMSFIGTVDMNNRASMPCYDNRVVNSLNYPPCRGSETSCLFIQSKVKFDVKGILCAIICVFLLIISTLSEYKCNVYIESVQLLLSFGIGFLFAYARLFPSK
jgi:hypothetical protein